MNVNNPLKTQHDTLPHPLNTCEKNKLFPYFQPIICAASGAIAGYEALARQYDNGRVNSAGELFSSRDIPVKQLIQWDRKIRRQAPAFPNWKGSWRPYFYELLALEYVKDGYRLITSERYRDFTTGLLCKTLSIGLTRSASCWLISPPNGHKEPINEY